MKCYKCGQEMYPVMDTAWRKHKDGAKSRQTEYICAECRVYMEIKVHDFQNCPELDEILKEAKE